MSIARRDDAGRDGATQAERVADRDHPFAEPQTVGIAELDRLELLVSLDPQEREVGLLILADQLGLDARAVIEDDGDLVGVCDDVVIGDHDAGRIDNEARPERVHSAWRVAAAVLVVVPLAAPIEEVTEQLVELRVVGQIRRRTATSLVARCYVLRRRDVDDRVDHPFGNIGDAVGPTRAGGRRKWGQHQGGQCKGGQGGPADLSGIPDECAEHGSLCSSREFSPGTVRLSGHGRKGSPDRNEMRLKIGQNRDHHIAVNAAYPRTSQIRSTPSKALTMPAIRSDPSGVWSALAASRLASPGDAAKINPSMASTRPIATRKSRIAKTSGRGLLSGDSLSSPLGPASLLGCARARLAGRIAEEAE